MKSFSKKMDETILRAALATHGSAGASGGDADLWKRMLTSFGDSSKQLRGAMAKLGRRLATSLEAYLANRLIPLDKCPGVGQLGWKRFLEGLLAKRL